MKNNWFPPLLDIKCLKSHSHIYKCCFYGLGISEEMKAACSACSYLQSQETFSKGSRSHLDPSLVAGVYLEVVPVGGVEPQQTQALGASVLPCK